ncbi:MAG: prepilin-type N-terminal cleavage/methylation domain-containing protein [Elusimicrobiota bacterium]|jgi:prepilin-type N-terminal cleavage/methylation domain-containing protein
MNMKTFAPARRGFTLIEMMVVVLIIGILSAIGIPQYHKTVETSKAENAAGIVKMMGTTNRMFMLDHNNIAAAGTFSATAVNSCNPSGACDGSSSSCQLVYCRYLAYDDWARTGYDIRVGNVQCCTPDSGLTGAVVACARRCSGSNPCSTSTTYTNWGYMTDVNGTLVTCGGAPRPGT